MTIWVTWSSPFESSFSRQFFVKAKRLPLSRPPRHTSSLWLQVSEQPISMEEKLLIRLNKVFHITVMWELIPLLVCNALRQSRKQPSLRCRRQGICPLHIQIGKEMRKTILLRLFHFESFDLFLSVFQGDLCRDSFLVQEEHQTLHERIELHKGTGNFRRTKEANLYFSKVPRQNSTFLVLRLPQFFSPKHHRDHHERCSSAIARRPASLEALSREA